MSSRLACLPSGGAGWVVSGSSDIQASAGAGLSSLKAVPCSVGFSRASAGSLSILRGKSEELNPTGFFESLYPSMRRPALFPSRRRRCEPAVQSRQQIGKPLLNIAFPDALGADHEGKLNVNIGFLGAQ